MTRWHVQITGADRDECRAALDAAGIEVTEDHVAGTRAEGPEVTAVVSAPSSTEARRAVEQALESVGGASVGPAASADEDD